MSSYLFHSACGFLHDLAALLPSLQLTGDLHRLWTAATTCDADWNLSRLVTFLDALEGLNDPLVTGTLGKFHSRFHELCTQASAAPPSTPVPVLPAPGAGFGFTSPLSTQPFSALMSQLASPHTRSPPFSLTASLSSLDPSAAAPAPPALANPGTSSGLPAVSVAASLPISTSPPPPASRARRRARLT